MRYGGGGTGDTAGCQRGVGISGVTRAIQAVSEGENLTEAVLESSRLCRLGAYCLFQVPGHSLSANRLPVVLL